MDGTVVEIGGPEHMDAGVVYDLLGLVCGSEGQLGDRDGGDAADPAQAGRRAAGVDRAIDDNEVTAGACVGGHHQVPGILPVAIEFMDRPVHPRDRSVRPCRIPGLSKRLLIVEVEGSEAEIEEQLNGDRNRSRKRHDPVELRRERHPPRKAPRSGSGRKSAFGAMGQINDYMCLDGTIPVSELPRVLARIGELSAEFGLDVANVFHAGDGNMHPLILFDANREGDLETCEALGAEILKLCVEVGGCLTGEHGVGIEKRDLMSVQFAPADMEAQMRVKDVFDPGWLLNPAKVFPLEASEGRRGALPPLSA